MAAPRERTEKGAGTLTKTRTGAKLKAPGMWQVVLHNDDFTTQEFVVAILRGVFHKPEAEAVRIMLSVHRAGKGVAGLYPRDVAETKAAQVRRLAEAQEFPLLCTLEPAP
ncbi:MAG: ATP-dependent Clp protease adaptor ClpS [Acidobacteria bacterium]|nr:ATP-dependent Clp protease adaptor ClpS [Acidobacteriota bacterium]